MPTEKQLVWIGKLTLHPYLLFLAQFNGCPLVAGAPEGLLPLLQQLNGIFFIPIASIIIAGSLLPKISSMGVNRISSRFDFLCYWRNRSVFNFTDKYPLRSISGEIEFVLNDGNVLESALFLFPEH